MKLKNILPAAALFALPNLAAAATVWLPPPGTVGASLSYVSQSAGEFFLGETESALPADLELDSYVLDLSFGITERVAAFGQLGTAESNFDAAGENDSGSTDTRVGIAWTVLDEFENFAMPNSWMPTVTLRAAAIVEGDYEVGRIDAIGDGGSGFEFAAAVGRVLLPNFTLFGDLGYRVRSDRVPDDLFASFGATVSLPLRTVLAVTYEYNDSQGELDIGGAGFTPERFPEVEEDRSLLTGSLNWAINPSFAVAVTYGQVLDGRNTPKSDAFGFTIGTSF